MLMSAATLHSGTTVAAVAAAPVIESAPVTLTAASLEPQVTKPIASVEQYVKTYFAETPILAKIAKCESRFRQYDSRGNVMRGIEVPEDLGVMQVNEYYHGDSADKLGYDLKTLDGNLAYAKWLYEREGTRPWNASRPCWGAN